MGENERRLFDSIVHGLRSIGWSKIDAEGDALDRIAHLRARPPQPSRKP